MINKIFGKIERLFSYQRHLNLFATLYLNLRTLPFRQAIKFPVYVYGSVEFSCLRGKILFQDVKLVPGLIKLGRHRDDYMLHSRSIIHLATVNSRIVFRGRCSIGDNFLIRVYDGCLNIGDKVWIGSNVSFICFNKIHIADFASITFNCKLIDSTCHYILDTESNTVSRLTGEIYVGSRNWICNNTTIMKGFKTGNNCIIASNSLCNKDYTLGKDCDELLIAGIPARIIKRNVRRIFSYNAETQLTRGFQYKKDMHLPFNHVKEDENDIIKFFV